MKIKKTLLTGLLGLSLVAAGASPAFARGGADDPAGHVRHGRGTDDVAGHVRKARGADDARGHVRHGRGSDDGVNHR